MLQYLLILNNRRFITARIAKISDPQKYAVYFFLFFFFINFVSSENVMLNAIDLSLVLSKEIFIFIRNY